LVIDLGSAQDVNYLFMIDDGSTPFAVLLEANSSNSWSTPPYVGGIYRITANDPIYGKQCRGIKFATQHYRYWRIHWNAAGSFVPTVSLSRLALGLDTSYAAPTSAEPEWGGIGFTPQDRGAQDVSLGGNVVAETLPQSNKYTLSIPSASSTGYAWWMNLYNTVRLHTPFIFTLMEDTFVSPKIFTIVRYVMFASPPDITEQAYDSITGDFRVVMKVELIDAL